MEVKMIYFIACLSSFLSGMGIGGGSSFIILSLLFELLNIDQARTYNLILFISVGIFIIFKNLKNKKIFDKKYFKSLFFIIIGCILGMILNKYINSEQIKKFFYIFMLIIGIYEIITSLINIKNENNNYKKGE